MTVVLKMRVLTCMWTKDTTERQHYFYKLYGLNLKLEVFLLFVTDGQITEDTHSSCQSKEASSLYISVLHVDHCQGKSGMEGCCRGGSKYGQICPPPLLTAKSYKFSLSPPPFPHSPPPPFLQILDPTL